MTNNSWQDRMAPKAPREPRLELVELCWRMRHVQKGTPILECAIWRTDVGLEVCAGYGQDELIYSMMISSVSRGRERAAELKQTVINRGGFEELPVSGTAS